MHYINFNGKMIKADTPLFPAASRAVRYGDGLFETIKFNAGELVLADDHFSRLWKGLQQLGFVMPKLFTPELLSREIHETVKKNKLSRARIRLAVYRGNGGLYDADNLHPNYIIETLPLQAGTQHLNSNGIQVIIYREAIKTADAFSQLKHNNFLPYIMGALYAKSNLCNDAILLNQHGRVCDSTKANIFLVSNDSILTPPVSEGCIAGVMRKFLVQTIAKQGYTLKEVPVTEEMLQNADEVFLTNSIQNINWVGAIGDKQYGNAFIKVLVEKLYPTNPEVFC